MCKFNFKITKQLKATDNQQVSSSQIVLKRRFYDTPKVRIRDSINRIQKSKGMIVVLRFQ
jgi:hypothetical protein